MKKVVFFGAGNIAQALIAGMISTGFNKKDILFVSLFLHRLTTKKLRTETRYL